MTSSNFAQKLDTFLDRVYGYQGSTQSPKRISGQVWAMPKKSLHFPWTSDVPNTSGGNIQIGETFFLHYFQSQGYGPTPNECVTTSVLMCINLLTEWIGASLGYSIESNRSIEEYAHELDHLGLRGWKYRFPTSSLLPGMMHPLQAVNALNDHADKLKEKFRKSYKVKLSSRHTVDELLQYLKSGNLLLLHGAWREKLQSNHFHLALMGGMPHTMVLVGYDGEQEKWILLNPGNPMPISKEQTVTPKLYKMTTEQFLNFWGRRFLFYPPRFSITTLSLDE